MNEIDATTAILSATSPLIVALIRRCHWSAEVVKLLSIAVVAVIYVIGRYLDNALVWPLAASFWTGLATAWAAQQVAFIALNNTPVLNSLEAMGNPDPNTDAVVQRDNQRYAAVYDQPAAMVKLSPDVQDAIIRGVEQYMLRYQARQAVDELGSTKSRSAARAERQANG